MDCSVGGVRVGSAAAGVRCCGEGLPALLDQLCGDGFRADPAAEAPLGPLVPLPNHSFLNDVGKSPCSPRFPRC